VLFINAENEVTQKGTDIYLEPEHIEKIVDAYNAYTPIDQFAAVASIEDIANKEYKLSIPQYVIKKGVTRSTEAERQRYYDEWKQQSLSTASEINSLTALI
jgi:type I restriction enzyme M protein